MTLSYEEAMATLETMFGDVDREVLTIVLESHGGHMERTVESLLVMTGEGDGTESTDPPRAQRTARRERSVPQDLPPGAEGEDSQIHQDAMLAKMLQDELFLEEMQRSGEFHDQFGNENAPYGRAGGNEEVDDGPSFTEKLRSMGEATKRKLFEFGERFQRGRARSNSSTGGGQSSGRYATLSTEDDTRIMSGDGVPVAHASSETLRSRHGNRHVDEEEEDEASLDTNKTRGVSHRQPQEMQAVSSSTTHRRASASEDNDEFDLLGLDSRSYFDKKKDD